MSGDKPKKYGSNKSQDLGSKDNKPKVQKDDKKGKKEDNEEEMTVVLPPSKSTESEQNGDVTMNGTSNESEQVEIDPKVKASNGMQRHCLSSSCC